MMEGFDPYYRWLGIAPRDQPPNHYRLLGIDLLEGNADVIQAAADRQMKHLRSYQMGEYASLSQELLNEVAQAKLCLLNPDRKAEYDQWLRELAGSNVAESRLPGLENEYRAVSTKPQEEAKVGWQYQIMGEAVGPVSDDELRALAAGGRVTGDTLVRQGVDCPWTLAWRVRGLFDPPVKPPSTAPPLTVDQPTAESEQPDEAETVSETSTAGGDGLYMVQDRNDTIRKVRVLLAALCVLAVILLVGLFTLAGQRTAELASVLISGLLAWIIVGGLLGGIIGSFKKATDVGTMLGALFGPLGLIAALGIDGRPECPRCGERLWKVTETCPHCHARLDIARERKSIREKVAV
jgi:hypothetical protein